MTGGQTIIGLFKSDATGPQAQAENTWSLLLNSRRTAADYAASKNHR